MPIFLEPDQTFEVCLDSDNDKPIESRPVFICLSQSMRGQRKILGVLELLQEHETVDNIFNSTTEELKRVIVGWRNVPKQFDANELDGLLTYNEARQLLGKVAYNQRMDANAKKN